MFSKEILKEDLEVIQDLKLQQSKCALMIGDAFKNIIENKYMTEKDLEDEKSLIYALNDNSKELNHELEIIEEQMFLNYSNTFAITSSRPSEPGKFPHINTIDL